MHKRASELRSAIIARFTRSNLLENYFQNNLSLPTSGGRFIYKVGKKLLLLFCFIIIIMIIFFLSLSFFSPTHIIAAFDGASAVLKLFSVTNFSFRAPYFFRGSDERRAIYRMHAHASTRNCATRKNFFFFLFFRGFFLTCAARHLLDPEGDPRGAKSSRERESGVKTLRRT